jgi:hypothetical protein
VTPPPVPIFDGHNDVLLRLYRRGGTEGSRAFLDGEEKGHLDLPKAVEGGLVGGLFAVFVPSSKPSSETATAPSPGVAAVGCLVRAWSAPVWLGWRRRAADLAGGDHGRGGD